MDKSLLSRWQMMPATAALATLVDFAKEDDSFTPTTAAHTSRWHARLGSAEFELLLNGAKFWDTRERVGGGGAVDLAMHLLKTDFKGAVAALRSKGV